MHVRVAAGATAGARQQGAAAGVQKQPAKGDAAPASPPPPAANGAAAAGAAALPVPAPRGYRSLAQFGQINQVYTSRWGGEPVRHQPQLAKACNGKQRVPAVTLRLPPAPPAAAGLRPLSPCLWRPVLQAVERVPRRVPGQRRASHPQALLQAQDGCKGRPQDAAGGAPPLCWCSSQLQMHSNCDGSGWTGAARCCCNWTCARRGLRRQRQQYWHAALPWQRVQAAPARVPPAAAVACPSRHCCAASRRAALHLLLLGSACRDAPHLCAARLASCISCGGRRGSPRFWATLRTSGEACACAVPQ